MGKSQAYIGHVLAFIAILIFSFNTNFMKHLMPEHIGAYGLVLARCIVSVVCFWVIGLFSKETKETAPTRRDIWMMMGAGVLAFSGNLLFYLKGLEITGPIDASVIRTMQPIMVIAIGVMFFRQKVTKYKVIGMILSVVGTLYMAIAPHNYGVSDSFLGDMFIFIATAFTAIYLIAIKSLAMKYKTATIMKWMSLSSLVVCFPFGIKELIHAPILHAERFSWILWGELAFSLIVATVLASFISVLSLRYISAFVKSTYIYIMPITGTLVAMLLKIQYPNWHDPLAFGFILAGFILVNLKNR